MASNSSSNTVSSQAVADHYDRHALLEWERLDRHRTEMAVTLLALDDYLPASARKIIDVGSGPGRYAIALADKGLQVDLVDISAVALRLAEEKAAEAGVVLGSRLQHDAMSLPEEMSSRYDAALLMGPLYHLLDPVARLTAARETWRVLKQGGLVFASFITRFAPLRNLAINSPGWIAEHPQRFKEMLEAGVNPARASSAFPESYFSRPEEISPLMTEAGFRQLLLVGCEGIVAGHEEAINALDGPLWDQWVRLNYELGQESSLHGAADHLLYVGIRS